MELDIGSGLQSGAAVLQGFMGQRIQANITDDLAKKAADRALTNGERLLSVQSMMDAQAESRRETLRQSGRNSDTQHQIDSAPGLTAAAITADTQKTLASTTPSMLDAARKKMLAGQSPENMANAGFLDAKTKSAGLENAINQKIVDLQMEATSPSTPAARKTQIPQELEVLRVGGSKAAEFILGQQEDSKGAMRNFTLNKGTSESKWVNPVEPNAPKGGPLIYNPETGRFD